MRDFGIEDFQISASTSAEGWTPHQSRLQGNGWCAQKDAYLSRGYDVFLEVNNMTTCIAMEHGPRYENNITLRLII